MGNVLLSPISIAAAQKPKMFAIPPKSPDRSPVPQPTTSHLTTPFLTSIAATLGVPLSDVCTFTVGAGSQLFKAIETYASYYPRPANLRQPFRWVIQEHYEEKMDDEMAVPATPCEPYADEQCEFSQAQPARKKSRTDPCVGLNFNFALGETLILWPPEPHLEAKTIKASLKEKGITLLERAAARPDIRYDDSKHTVFHLTRYEMNSFDGGLEYFHVATAAGELNMKKFAYEVLRWAKDQQPDGPKVGTFILQQFVVHQGCGGWTNKGPRCARETQSVILSKGCMNEILQDVKHFLEPSTKAWFAKHGLPYKRNYLFFGTPGTGKTSTIRVIAGAFGLNCAFLSTTDSNFSNQLLFEALTTLPRNTILVIEDVDSMFNKNRENEARNSLSYSGLLNALDGITSMEGVITIMTTNHFERLDQALIRGGRVDKRVFFPPPSHEQIESLFKRFYPEASEEQRKIFSKKVFAYPEGREAQSIATLQQFFVRNREKSADACLEGLEEFYGLYFTEKQQTEQVKRILSMENKDASDVPDFHEL
ncbi:Mitochondrial chaperone BCS1 [Gracilaria domingensis]|nr:Mitochondrial chaperone BCS1 [Gracilaria domingensis]